MGPPTDRPLGALARVPSNKVDCPKDLSDVAVTLAHTFGWRTQSAVLVLELQQLDLKEGTVRLDVGSTKNDDGRSVYLMMNSGGCSRPTWRACRAQWP